MSKFLSEVIKELHTPVVEGKGIKVRRLTEADDTRRARVSTKSKTKSQFDKPDLSAFERGMQDQAAGTQNVPAPSQRKQKAVAPSLKQATAKKTKAATAGLDMPPEAAEKFSFIQSLDIEDEISDEEAARRAGVTHGAVPEPKTPGTDVARIETLPAVINKELLAAGEVEPEWHQVKNLPGYLSSAIRAMGRQIFGTYTNTPIEDIQVLAHVAGQGPNSKRELNAVGGWLHKNAERDVEGEMDFSKSIPNYGVEFKIYNTRNFTFMVVKDFAGLYIYSWPTADNKKLT